MRPRILRTPLHVRPDVDPVKIRAAATDPNCDGLTLHGGESPAQIDAIDRLLLERPDFRVCVGDADGLAALDSLLNVRCLQLFFGLGDDPIDLVAALGRFPLRRLRLHVPWLHDLSCLEVLPAGLEWLAIEETERPKRNLAVLARFPSLRVLRLDGPGDPGEALAGLNALEELSLQSVRHVDYGFLEALLRLRRLRIALCRLEDLSPVAALPDLRYLELWMLKGLGNLDALTRCRALVSLHLDSLPAITRLPDLSGLTRLAMVTLNSMNGLVDFSGLARCEALEVVAFTPSKKPAARPRDLADVLSAPALRQARIGFGHAGLNREFDALADASGISLTWDPDWARYEAMIDCPD
jgi:hypothetical protein